MRALQVQHNVRRFGAARLLSVTSPKASARIAPVHLRNVDDLLNQPVWAGRKSPLGSLEFAVQILRSSMAMRLPTLKTSSHFR